MPHNSLPSSTLGTWHCEAVTELFWRPVQTNPALPSHSVPRAPAQLDDALRCLFASQSQLLNLEVCVGSSILCSFCSVQLQKTLLALMQFSMSKAVSFPFYSKLEESQLLSMAPCFLLCGLGHLFCVTSIFLPFLAFLRFPCAVLSLWIHSKATFSRLQTLCPEQLSCWHSNCHFV